MTNKKAIAAEIIGIPDGSLGERLYLSKIWVETDTLLAYTLVIIAVSLMTKAPEKNLTDTFDAVKNMN